MKFNEKSLWLGTYILNNIKYMNNFFLYNICMQYKYFLVQIKYILIILTVIVEAIQLYRRAKKMVKDLPSIKNTSSYYFWMYSYIFYMNTFYLHIIIIFSLFTPTKQLITLVSIEF